MSVVEIRKTKTREQGSYYCTGTLLLVQHSGQDSGWVQCRSEDPLTGLPVPYVCPCAPVCPVGVPAPPHVFLPVPNKSSLPITDGYKYMLIRIIGTEETAESAFEHGGRLLPNL